MPVSSQSSASAEKKTAEKLATSSRLADSPSEQANGLSKQPANLSRQAVKPSEEPTKPARETDKLPDQANHQPKSMELDALSLSASWPEFAGQLPLTGMAAQLARQSEIIRIQGRTICLRVPTRALAEGQHVERLRMLLAERLGAPLLLEFEIGEGHGESAHAKDLARQQLRQRAAEEAVEQDPFVRSLLQDFDGRVVPGSVQPGPSLQ